MQDDIQDIQNVPSSSPDLKTELAKKLQELMPEIIADGKVDTQKLKELLTDDIGDDTERFGLFWPGKKRAMRAAQEPTTATLKPAPNESKDWDTTKNLFIEGDNLEVLKVMQRQYHNKVKMIYIDPPYNTGKDFVYPDNFKEGLTNYLEFTKQVDEGGKKISTNSETEGRYHSNWLNMMYPRLKLARNLLTDDGAIFISIDDNEVDNLKKLCNEVFGENNFVSQIVWKKKTGSGTQIEKVFSEHEYVLVYTRNSQIAYSWRIESEEDGNFKNPDNDPRGPWESSALTAPSKNKNPNQLYRIIIDYAQNAQNYEGVIDQFAYNGNNIYLQSVDIDTPLGEAVEGDVVSFVRRWAYIPTSMRKMFENGRVYINGTNLPRYKKFQSEYIGKALKSIYFNEFSTQQGSDELKSLFNGIELVEYPKPLSLIKHLSSGLTKDNDTILDFFSGSSTTAHAIMQLNAEDGGNRRHIQVQLPEPTDEKSEAYKAGYKTIAQIARERINRAGEKIKADYAEKIAAREQPLDIGYRTYKLADTNFIKWQNTYTTDVTQLQARLDLMRESSNDNASQLDLLTEIILKLGLELTTEIHQIALEDLPIYSAADGSLLLYLDEHITPTLDQLRTILEGDYKPAKFVILEDSFKGGDQLKTNLTQICKSNNIELWTV